MKRRFRLFSCIAAMASFSAGISQAATIGVNFAHGDWMDNTGVQTGETAMGIPGSAWTNIPNQGAGGSSSGTTTAGGLTVAWNSANAWQAGSEGLNGTDASQQVFRNYLDDGDGGASYFDGDGYGVSIQVSGLSSFMGANSATKYSITLYFATDATAVLPAEIRQGLLPSVATATAISSLTQIGTVTPGALGDGTYPFSTGAGTATDGHRAIGTLDGLSADAITIAIPKNPGANGVRGSLAGFSISAVPEPSVSLMLGGLGLVGLLRRRR